MFLFSRPACAFFTFFWLVTSMLVISSLQHDLDRCLYIDGTQSEMADILSNMRVELVDCSADVRSIMNELRPTVLDELGLYEAVTEYISNLADLVPFSIKTQIDPKLKDWHSAEDAMLFRLIQEALLNIRKSDLQDWKFQAPHR